MIGGTRQIVVEDNQRVRIKTTGFLQIKVSQKWGLMVKGSAYNYDNWFMIGGTRQIVVEDNQRARIKTAGFLQIKVSQKGLGKSSFSIDIPSFSTINLVFRSKN